jgi:prepilin-type N-terminal cleavage/methylation domain-containing protein
MPKDNAGFTLIEIMLVASVAGLLLVIALAGQHQLQARARFDAAINKTLQNIAYARNTALTSINVQGGGNDPTTVIGGISFELNNGHYAEGFPMEEITTLYSSQDSSGYLDINNLSELPSAGIGACSDADHPNDSDECQELFVDLDDPLTFSTPDSTTWTEIIFLNTGHGIRVCENPDGSPTSIAEACVAGLSSPYDITLTDPEGFSAKIEIDPFTGFAKRL